MSAVIVIVATGDGPPACPLVTTLFGMSTTTTAFGSLKSKATTSPVSTSFGPMSGSSNALSKMPPMYLVTSSELLNPIVPSLLAPSQKTYSVLKNIVRMIGAKVNSRGCLRHARAPGADLAASCAPREPGLVTLGQRVRLDDLIDDQLSRFSAGGGAAVGVLLDGVADIPQPGERGFAGKVESGGGTWGRPAAPVRG